MKREEQYTTDSFVYDIRPRYLWLSSRKSRT